MFIFYDTETTGLNADFDQILQIALVFTDENLNVLSSKKLECRRSPWVVPSPGAMLITGFTPDDLKNAKLSNAEMMDEVLTWTRNQHWPVIFAGYNTIGFDEGILARNLEQNLQDPGLTTAANKYNDKTNGRFDVFMAVKAAFAYMPGLLTLAAKNEYGSVKLSLSSVAAQNGVVLSSEDAHDAMNDIRATLNLAKVIKKAAPQLWEQLTLMSTSKGVDEFIKANDVFTHTTVAGGKVNAAVVTSVGEGILFDLSKDPSAVMAMSVEQLTLVLSQRNAQPFRMINKSEQPILMPLEQSDAVLPQDFNDATAASRRQMILSDQGFLDRLAEAQKLAVSQVKKLAVPPEICPVAITDPVVSAKLDTWKKSFLSATDWKSAADCVARFYDEIGAEEAKKPEVRRFVNFAGRLVFEHAPQYLPAEQQQKMREYIASRVLSSNPNAAWTTVAKARKELEQIEKERLAGTNERWAHVQDKDIRALKLYYTSLEKEYAPYLRMQPPVNDNPAAQTIQPKKNDGFKP